MIRGISFDLNNTLVDFSPKQGFSSFFYAYIEADIRKTLSLEMSTKKESLSNIRMALIRNVFSCGKITDALIQYNKQKRVRLYPDTVPALEQLSRQYTLGVLSNANWNTFVSLADLGIKEYFKAEVYSFECGCRKPDTGAFHAIAKALNLPPEEILHVGDSLRSDYLGARAFGCKAIWIVRDPNQSPLLDRDDVKGVRSLTEIPSILAGLRT